MKVNGTDYDAEGRLATVRVTMSMEEAAFLAQMLRVQPEDASNALMRGGADHAIEIFDAIVDMVFNRLVDGGVDGFLRDRGLKP